MKKLSRLFLNAALASTLFLGYSMVRAQDQNPSADAPGGDHPAMNGDHMDGGKGRLERMKKELKLTDDQAAKLKELFKREREANKPLLDQVKIDTDTLKQKVDSKASQSDIKSALDKLSSDRKEMEESRKNSMEKMRSILTPEQQAKMVLMMQHRMGKKGDWKKHEKDGDKPADAAPDQSAAPAPDNAQ